MATGRWCHVKIAFSLVTTHRWGGTLASCERLVPNNFSPMILAWVHDCTGVLKGRTSVPVAFWSWEYLQWKSFPTPRPTHLRRSSHLFEPPFVWEINLCSRKCCEPQGAKVVYQLASSVFAYANWRDGYRLIRLVLSEEHWKTSHNECCFNEWWVPKMQVFQENSSPLTWGKLHYSQIEVYPFYVTKILNLTYFWP